MTSRAENIKSWRENRRQERIKVLDDRRRAVSSLFVPGLEQMFRRRESRNQNWELEQSMLVRTWEMCAAYWGGWATTVMRNCNSQVVTIAFLQRS